MLRGIRKASSNWLGKIVMATVMGVLIVSFAVWGIADIFKGFGQSSLATVGKLDRAETENRTSIPAPMAEVRAGNRKRE